jgi:hypothetical protein
LGHIPPQVGQALGVSLLALFLLAFLLVVGIQGEDRRGNEGHPHRDHQQRVAPLPGGRHHDVPDQGDQGQQ